MPSEQEPAHWLVRPRTVRWLWTVFAAALLLTLLLQFAIPIKGYFVVDAWFGFSAAFGFLACVSIVVFAKLLGRILKRSEHFYDE